MDPDATNTTQPEGAPEVQAQDEPMQQAQETDAEAEGAERKGGPQSNESQGSEPQAEPENEPEAESENEDTNMQQDAPRKGAGGEQRDPKEAAREEGVRNATADRERAS